MRLVTIEFSAKERLKIGRFKQKIACTYNICHNYLSSNKLFLFFCEEIEEEKHLNYTNISIAALKLKKMLLILSSNKIHQKFDLSSNI